jgi:hypothetical protein
VVTVTGARITLQLEINIWIPQGATQQVIEHEEGHRQISEYYYRSAQEVAEKVAAEYTGKQISVSGSDLGAEINAALQKIGAEITAEYGERLNPNAAQQRYDDLTDHSRNDIAASDAVARVLRGMKERVSVSRCHQLCASLAAAIRIVAAQHGFFAVRPEPFAVFIALIRGNYDHGLYTMGLPDGVQNVHRAEDVRVISSDWVGVGFTHQGLRCHVYHYLRIRSPKSFEQEGRIAHITFYRCHAMRDVCQLKKAGRSRRLGGVSGDLGAHQLEPER